MESWRLEPRLSPVDDASDELEGNPPLWKDLTLASIVALLLWLGAALMVG